MAEHVIKLPDVGEGVAEAELVEWHVKVGDLVREDAILGAVMTDKATVEIPSPVEGKVLWLGADVGDVVAVGSDLVRLDVAGEGVDSAPLDAAPEAPAPAQARRPHAEASLPAAPRRTRERRSASRGRRARSTGRGCAAEGEKPLACARRPPARARGRHRPASGRRHRARRAASPMRISMRSSPTVRGRSQTPVRQARTAVEDIKVVGLRRRIAEKMSLANSRIPHITYVEEVDVTALEDLRAALNASKRQDQPKLSFLPFLMRAMVRAIDEQPQSQRAFR